MVEQCRIEASVNISGVAQFLAVSTGQGDSRYVFDQSSEFFAFDPKRRSRTRLVGGTITSGPLAQKAPKIGTPARQAHYDIIKRLHEDGWKNAGRHDAPWWAWVLEREWTTQQEPHTQEESRQ